jgi:hypothetical protein
MIPGIHPGRNGKTMSGYEITCANVNPNGMLVRIGGVNWSLAVHEAIVQLVSQQVRLFVRMDDRMLEVGIRGEGSSAYLALEPDGLPLHDLPGLASC